MVISTWGRGMKRITGPSMRYMVLLTAFVFIGIYSIYLLTFKNDSKTDTHVPFLPIEHLTFCRQREVEKEPETCSKVVLRDATRGHWVPKSLRENQKKEFLIAHNASQRYFGLRFPFDRLDGLCGNVTQFRKDFSSKWNIKNLFGHENKMLIFPAICNPKGSKPCCYNGRCTDLSEAECACPNCQDDRRTQHAEMAEWQTNDEKCLLKDVGQDATCGILLHKFDLVIFLGDSLIRQLYLALLLKLLGGPSQSILVDGTPEELKRECAQSVYAQSLLVPCNHNLKKDIPACRGRLRVVLLESGKVDSAQWVFKYLQTLPTLNRTLFVFGVGIHDNLDVLKNQHGYILPFLSVLKQRPRDNPGLIWVNPHLPGLLKPIMYQRQMKDEVLRYGKVMTRFFKSLCIPVMDTDQITKGVFSYDGTHYGYGVNELKIRVLLSYIRSFN